MVDHNRLKNEGAGAGEGGVQGANEAMQPTAVLGEAVGSGGRRIGRPVEPSRDPDEPPGSSAR